MFVYKRQPWIVRRQNMLLETVDPAKDLSEYQFQYMYVTVKLYGIPNEARTIPMMHYIL